MLLHPYLLLVWRSGGQKGRTVCWWRRGERRCAAREHGLQGWFKADVLIVDRVEGKAIIWWWTGRDGGRTRKDRRRTRRDRGRSLHAL